MFAGSVTRRASTPASLIRARVLSSLPSYSSSGNAAIGHLLGPPGADQQTFEDPLRGIEIIEADRFVGAVRRLLDVTGSEQHAWYPRRVNEEARVAGRAPRRDTGGHAAGDHRRRHRAHDLVLRRNLKWQVVGPDLDVGFEPGHAPSRQRDRRFQLVEDRCGGLARVDPAVDLDRAAVGHYVRTRASVDGA